jgi:hypothetical protein
MMMPSPSDSSSVNAVDSSPLPPLPTSTSEEDTAPLKCAVKNAAAASLSSGSPAMSE